jgi:predicted RNA binding protein YcfA (HicA-like mRNA interferase family)
MKLPRDLSGADLIKLLGKHFDYRRVNQVGSHVILETSDPRQHRISIPDHTPLRVGTLNGILRAIATAKGVEKEDILRHLQG